MWPRQHIQLSMSAILGFTMIDIPLLLRSLCSCSDVSRRVLSEGWTAPARSRGGITLIPGRAVPMCHLRLRLYVPRSPVPTHVFSA